MLVSPDGDVIITNDGATILEKMEVGTRTEWIKTYSKGEVGQSIQNIFNVSCSNLNF